MHCCCAELIVQVEALVPEKHRFFLYDAALPFCQELGLSELGLLRPPLPAEVANGGPLCGPQAAD